MPRIVRFAFCFVITLLAATSFAQQPTTSAVPSLIRFSGTLQNTQATTGVSAPVGVTFAIYKQQEGGAPIWQETQNVTPDVDGHYTVLLGTTSATGVPDDLFSQQEQRWLGVQLGNQAEQPRVLMVSVPYAFKAHDAETLGGLPASSFVRAPSNGASGNVSISGLDSAAATSGGAGKGGKSSSGVDTVINCTTARNNYLVMFTSSNPPNITVCNSVMYQLNGKIGIGTTSPAATLDVNDSGNPAAYVVSGTTTNSAEIGIGGVNLGSASGSGIGVVGRTTGATGAGVYGFHDSTTGAGFGVSGLTQSSSGVGVIGLANTPTGSATGVSGGSASVDGVGVVGFVSSTGGQGHKAFGVEGIAQDPNGAAGTFGNTAVSGMALGMSALTNSPAGKGVYGVGVSESHIGQQLQSLATMGVWGDSASGIGVYASSDDEQAVYGVSASSTSAAVVGLNQSTSGSAAYGVAGDTASSTNNASGVFGIAMATTGNTYGVEGKNLSGTGVGVYGWASSATGNDSGVVGQSDSTTNAASGVFGVATAHTGQVYGVVGSTNSTAQNSSGVYGNTTATTGNTNGVFGSTASSNGTGVYGVATSTDTSGFGYGVYGASANGTGVYGSAQSSSVCAAGVVAYSASTCADAVYAVDTGTSGNANGIYAQTNSAQGVAGYFNNEGGGYILVGTVHGNGSHLFHVDGAGDGYFAGNLSIGGTLSKGGGSFKIDDPLDPENKYLSHSFVESPDMMNIYNGLIKLDAHGEAWVDLPDYFEALNRDFRYQLTSVGAPQPRLYIAREVNGNRFKIAGGKPSAKVSWQVTGIRQDAWANAHRIPTEEDKPLEKRGSYLHPEAFGANNGRTVSVLDQPQAMKEK